eukprot:10974997-Alexandrium_andersonii.AAC.1
MSCIGSCEHASNKKNATKPRVQHLPNITERASTRPPEQHARRCENMERSPRAFYLFAMAPSGVLAIEEPTFQSNDEESN